MTKSFRSTLAAFMLSAAVIMPAASVTFIATTEVAEAKSKKAKKAKKDRSAKKAKGNKRTMLEAQSSKKGKKAKKPKKASQKAAAVEAVEDGEEVALTDLHPSQLGNMNGALNANENAILAHIRNGNTSNGPVGHMAALAIAGYDRDAVEDILNSPQGATYASLDEAAQNAVDEEANSLGFESYADYQDYLDEGGAPIASIDDAYNENFGSSALNDALAAKTDDEGVPLYGSYEDYRLAVEENPELQDDQIDLAYSNVDGWNADTAKEFETAGTKAADYDDAMQDMLDYWNKGDGDSENADSLKAMLEARLDTYENVGTTVDDGRDEDTTTTEGDPDDLACEEDALVCDTDETAQLAE